MKEGALGAGKPIGTSTLIEPWIGQSWQRCLSLGLSPQKKVLFEAVSIQAMRRHTEQNRILRETARDVISDMQHTLARTGYFALLTNATGTVIDASGPIDMHDRRASAIARIGVDLSESTVGTTAIGAALAELKPVWLHRGEHFFSDNTVYSCAGAPIFGSDGACVGMLDLTGIEAPERRELQHLVAQAALHIENRLAQSVPHALSLQLYWPGLAATQDTGWLGLDEDGCICTINRAARTMLGLPAGAAAKTVLHCDEVFATTHNHVFDAARRSVPVELPLWSGLSVMARAKRSDDDFTDHHGDTNAPLKTLTIDFIRKTVDHARGNVSAAAQTLGISRATVYRKLKRKP
jgi:sigma-54 dependent transcriptional regulator, acetoin dehydrogenase operon transcriptional activator AcoR